jgi:hypothetical protein
VADVVVQIVVEGLDVVLAARHLFVSDAELEEVACEVADEEDNPVPDERQSGQRHQVDTPLERG